MDEPLAATRLVVWGKAWSDADAGKTHLSAPESIRNALPESLSVIDIVPLRPPAAAINGRPCRFPEWVEA